MKKQMHPFSCFLWQSRCEASMKNCVTHVNLTIIRCTTIFTGNLSDCFRGYCYTQFINIDKHLGKLCITFTPNIFLR